MSLERTGVIDALGMDEKSGRLTMVIRHDAAWDGSDIQLYQLQEKLNAYLSFALDGEMAETCPDFAGMPLAVRIDTTSNPDARTTHFLSHVRQQIEFQDIALEVRIIVAGESPADGDESHGCGGHCHCH